jgi:actin-related protein 3
MFKDFGRRLQRDVKHIVDGRIANSETASGSHMRVSPGRNGHDLPDTTKKLTLSTVISPAQSSGVEVNVISHKRQRFAVWYGGSLMASLPEFYNVAHTKAQYEEFGPSLVRRFSVFGSAS